jgi:hypothetical protein
MNSPNHKTTHAGVGEAEETLRLIAGLPAPEGLEDRVHLALAKAPRMGRILRWPLSASHDWMHGALARGAAAAAIVCVVAGGGWEVYSRVQPAPAPRVIVMPHVIAPGGFSSANAIRTPKTLNGPTLKHPIETQNRVHTVGKRQTDSAKKPTKGAKTDAARAVAQ